MLFVLAFAIIIGIAGLIVVWIYKKYWLRVLIIIFLGIIGGVMGYFYPSEGYSETHIIQDSGKMFILDGQQIRMIYGIVLGMVVGIVAVFTAIKLKIVKVL